MRRKCTSTCIKNGKCWLFAEYLQMGVAVPGHCIVSPQSAIVTEAKRIETRLMIELVAIGCAGFIPPGLIALLINMIH